MNILIMTIPISILLATLFILFFIKAVRSEQFDDLETPAHIVLLDEIEKENEQRYKKELERITEDKEAKI
ncbi:MAG: cbb3-type cytochrome oxidase assembly protein CcoS [Bdellovibrionaceae bacterium]|nr:cbb3-type cytochrome oxidase assembly protein CcoS [Pseudobdellovibrionaceae bacterium]